MFEVLKRHSSNRVFPEQLAAEAPKAIFLFRPSWTRDLENAQCLADARLVWSQWEGYLADPSFATFVEWQRRSGIPMDVFHTSGHASISDLQRLAKAINPKRLVPIHSFESGRYAEFFSNVECRNDGERWSL
jgi:ribonuclease J